MIGGRIRKLAAQGDAAPGTARSSFANDPVLGDPEFGTVFERFLQNDRGDAAFLSGLCCDSFPAGIFLSASPDVHTLHGDFELTGELGLPANWQTVWHNSGSGVAFRFDGNDSEAMKGTSVLRLHVDAGGGSTFVLSDPLPVSADSVYIVSSWMRYNLVSPNDSVFFSVLQFDAAGNVVGFDEVPGIAGENYWQWEPERLLIHTTAVASSVRIRFGLISASESYLDVDAVQ